jgi:hypothetical protein
MMENELQLETPYDSFVFAKFLEERFALPLALVAVRGYVLNQEILKATAREVWLSWRK